MGARGGYAIAGGMHRRDEGVAAMERATMNRVVRWLALATVIGLTSAPPVRAQAYQLLHAFYKPATLPNQPLVEPDGTIYGTTRSGGRFTRGTLYRRDPDGTVIVLHEFNESEGVGPYGALVRGTDGALYGVTLGGGPDDDGTIFKWDGRLTTLHAFSYSDGSQPWGGVVQGSDGALYGTTLDGGALGYGTLFRWDGSLTTLHDFQGYTSSNGAYPIGSLVIDPDGTIYGTTSSGGSSYNFGGGTIFKWKDGFSILYRFPLTSDPTGVVRGADGALYGTTGYSGYGNGGIFKWDGSLTMLHQFDFTDGANPLGGLVEGADGAMYGTTSIGGAGQYGTVFKWDGGFTTLHEFDGTDGADVEEALTLGADGSLYGATRGQGYSDGGSLFRIDTSGLAFEVLLQFPNQAPTQPLGPPVMGSDGALYGTTYTGGLYGFGTLYRLGTDGAFTVVHSFASYDSPVGGLTRGTDGALYGLTWGTLFRWDGSYTTLYGFGWGDGYPQGGVIQGTDGALYGTTSVRPVRWDR